MRDAATSINRRIVARSCAPEFALPEGAHPEASGASRHAAALMVPQVVGMC